MSDTQTTTVPVAEAVAARHPGVAVRRAVVDAASTTMDADAARLWTEAHRQWTDRSRGEIRRHPAVAAYRAFAADLGLQPDRNPPSIQMLIDRGLRGKALGSWPDVNPAVNLLNAQAVTTMTALGAFDADRVEGEVLLRFSEAGEPFTPLGAEATALDGGQLVLADRTRVLSLFAQRDGVHQAVRADSRRLMLLGCVVPGVAAASVANAVDELAQRMSAA